MTCWHHGETRVTPLQIRNIRNANGLSQQQFANELTISQSRVSQIENGGPRPGQRLNRDIIRWARDRGYIFADDGINVVPYSRSNGIENFREPVLEEYRERERQFALSANGRPNLKLVGEPTLPFLPPELLERIRKAKEKNAKK